MSIRSAGRCTLPFCDFRMHSTDRDRAKFASQAERRARFALVYIVILILVLALMLIALLQ
jgi:CHASE3 domain sensor protein